MDKNILFKSLLQGIAGMLLFALLVSVVRAESILQVLAAPYTIVLGVSAVVGSYAGFLRKAKKGA